MNKYPFVFPFVLMLFFFGCQHDLFRSHRSEVEVVSVEPDTVYQSHSSCAFSVTLRIFLDEEDRGILAISMNDRNPMIPLELGIGHYCSLRRFNVKRSIPVTKNDTLIVVEIEAFPSCPPESLFCVHASLEFQEWASAGSFFFISIVDSSLADYKHGNGILPTESLSKQTGYIHRIPFGVARRRPQRSSSAIALLPEHIKIHSIHYPRIWGTNSIVMSYGEMYTRGS